MSMGKREWVFALAIIFVFVIVLFLGFGVAGNIINIQADIEAGDSYTAIDVSNNSINFGSLKKGEVSAYKVITVNNTGTDKINLTLSMLDYSGTIFNYIFVRKSPGNDADYLPLNKFSFTLDSGKDQDLRFILDLRNYPNPIYKNTHLSTNITVSAMPLNWAVG